MTAARWWRRLDRIGRGAENLLLMASLVVMIAVAVAQIVMRNAGWGGLVWGDEFLRLVVLWLAMIGAIAASRDDHHIRIDILSRFLPPRAGFAVRAVIDVFTCAVCAVIAWYAVAFVGFAFEFEDQALGGLPLWWFQTILPLGFGLIAYRYGLLAIRHTVAAVRGAEPAS